MNSPTSPGPSKGALPPERSSDQRRPTLSQSLCIGAFGFCAVSLIVFASWAWMGKWMHRYLSELGAYSVWALMFVLGAGFALRRLVVGTSITTARLYVSFAAAFLLYSVGWTVAWFALRNKAGEWLGSFVGTALMTLVFVAAFSAWRSAAKIFAGLFIAHSLGYFVGELLYLAIASRLGMLLWGLIYGLGFGAGIGYALFDSANSPRVVPPTK